MYLFVDGVRNETCRNTRPYSKLWAVIKRVCISNTRRCRVYYCDPQRSGQKGRCEKNRAEPGRILPKGSSFEALTAFDVATVCPRRQLPEEEPGRQDAVCARRQAHPPPSARRARDIQARGRRGRAETGSAAGQARLVCRQREGIAPGHVETPPERCAWSFKNRRRARASMP